MIARTRSTAAAGILVLALAGCGGSDPDDATVRLAFVTNTQADFWTLARRGTERADLELGDVEVEFRLADGTAADQRRIVDDLLTTGVEGVAISPVDPANQTQMLNDLATRAVVLTQDSDAPESDRRAYIGTDNLAAGRQAGTLMREALPGGGRIMLFVGKIDAQNAQERAQGIREALEGSNVEIIDVLTDDTDQVRARANAAETIVRYPDIAGMIGLWGYNPPAILNAVREAGRVGDIRIVAFDDEAQTLEGVREGAIAGTIVQQPFEFGYQAIYLMYEILNGDESGIPADGQRFIPTLVVTSDDVDAYIESTSALRGN